MRHLAPLTLLALAACQSTPKIVQPPEVVRVTVEVPAKVPEWATAPLPNDPPADATVGAVVEANNRRAEVIDVANCQRRLLRAWSDGKPADPKACRKP